MQTFWRSWIGSVEDTPPIVPNASQSSYCLLGRRIRCIFLEFRSKLNGRCVSLTVLSSSSWFICGQFGVVLSSILGPSPFSTLHSHRLKQYRFIRRPRRMMDWRQFETFTNNWCCVVQLLGQRWSLSEGMLPGPLKNAVMRRTNCTPALSRFIMNIVIITVHNLTISAAEFLANLLFPIEIVLTAPSLSHQIQSWSL